MPIPRFSYLWRPREEAS